MQYENRILQYNTYQSLLATDLGLLSTSAEGVFGVLGAGCCAKGIPVGCMRCRVQGMLGTGYW